MSIHRRLGVLLLGALSALLACGSSSSPNTGPADLRILFIGNSLTSFNDLPGMVRRLGAAVDGKGPTVQSVVLPAFSLEDHWHQGSALQAIAGQQWDLVVLQQGPSALPESRALLVEYAKKFDVEIKKSGGRTAMYMVWPEQVRAEVWDDVSESYAEAARAVGGVLMPAGEAFRSALRLDATLQLFGSDGYHPSPTGSCLAALVIYAEAAGRSPANVLDAAHLVDLSPSATDALEAGAADAIERFGIR